MKMFPIVIKKTIEYYVWMAGDSASEALDGATEKYCINGDDLPNEYLELPIDISLDTYALMAHPDGWEAKNEN